ncbi:hypothetical protein T492DRAFT_873365, partial [Pavlovales sp. CCMP2436]
MAGASSSAASSLLSAQLPGSGLEVGTNHGFEGPEGERALLEQTVPDRARAALYAFVVGKQINDRVGQSNELDLKAVKAVHAATRTVHDELKGEQLEALKAAGLAYFFSAFVFALADHLGCTSMLGTGASDERFINLGKNVLCSGSGDAGSGGCGGGSIAKVVGYDRETGRYEVMVVEGSHLKLKRENATLKQHARLILARARSLHTQNARAAAGARGAPWFQRTGRSANGPEDAPAHADGA